MEFNLFFGSLIIVVTLFVIFVLYWWSCRTIEKIGHSMPAQRGDSEWSTRPPTRNSTVA